MTAALSPSPAPHPAPAPQAAPQAAPSATTITAADRLIWQMSLAISDGDTVATGVASPLAVLAIAVARATHAPGLHYLACVGSLNPSVTRLLGSSEDLAYLDGRAADISIPELFDHARRGRLDVVFFGAAEVDAAGRTNMTAAGSLATPRSKFPGVVGACSLRRWCKRPVLVVPRQGRRCLVPQVSVRSTVDDARRTRLLTDLAVFSLGEGGAVLEAVGPHASAGAVRERTGFPFEVSDRIATIPDPPPHALDAIRRLDPLHLRGELVGS
jgi:glutaconate CoA-transferase subunit B